MAGICVVSGMAGIGKTALAVRWAHRVAHHFPDGQLYLDLRGYDATGKAMDPAEAVRRLLVTLGVEAGQIPADLDARAALYRSVLAGKRLLVILDNARDAAQVRPLRPGAPTCLLVVVSRNQLTGLVTAGARHIVVDLLTGDEARELLGKRLSTNRVIEEPSAVQEIIARCARLPLALAIVAARAASRRGSLAAVAAELWDTTSSFDTLSCGDEPHTDLRSVFSWSYQVLTLGAAQLFRLLSLHPGPEFAAAAAASIAGLPLSQVRPALSELVRANLVVETSTGQYSFHDLLRVYAGELAQSGESADLRDAATHRMLDHYLHTAHAAALLVHPTRDAITLTRPQPGVSVTALSDEDQALGWFAAEHATLIAMIDLSTTGWDTIRWQLAWTLLNYLDRGGHWHDWIATSTAAVAAARRLEDNTAQARAHRSLALAYIRLDRMPEAQAQMRCALDLAIKAGDRVGSANTHINLAILCERRGDHGEALDHAWRALDLFRAAGNQPGEAHALNVVGWYLALLGEHTQALVYCQQALDLHTALNNLDGQAETWDSLGFTHHLLGSQPKATECYQHALNLYRDLSDRPAEAVTLTRLGDVHHAALDDDSARRNWQQALAILDDLDHPGANDIRAKLAGED